MYDIDSRRKILECAREIFFDECFSFQNETSSYAAINQPVLDTIVDIVGDSGTMYINNDELLKEIWFKHVLSSETSAATLLHMSSRFIVSAFSSLEEYGKWVDHLCNAFSVHTCTVESYAVVKIGADMSVIDDEVIEQLPLRSKETTSDYKTILANNPWYVYLVTLSMRWPSIFNELIAKNALTRV